MMNRRRLLKIASAVALSGVALSIVRAQPAASSTRLLFVHGRGQQGLNPATLKATWLAALKRGAAKNHQAIPSGVDVQFPFYGDKLDEFTRQFAIPLTSDVHARGNAVDDEFLAFQAEFAEEVRIKAGVTDAQVDAEYVEGPDARGPLNWKWVQAILRAIDKNGTGMNQKTLELFTRDVFLYSTRPGVRDEIDRIVAAQLSQEPTVVVAHSLGTVVAYSILTTDRRDLKVPIFVTVGSPLAVRAVRDQFRPLRSPTPVTRWYNAFDTRDVVVLYPLDDQSFPVQPAIENNATVNNHTDNRHGIDGYLDDSAVAKRILDALGASG
jgi:hypothetical protein